MDGSIYTRARYPSLVPADLPRAEPATLHRPRTTLSFAELAAMERSAYKAHYGQEQPERHAHNSGKRASDETLQSWLDAIAALPGPFIALDAQNAMGCAKSAAHNRLHMLQERGMVRKVPGRRFPQLWEVVKKDEPRKAMLAQWEKKAWEQKN